MLEAALAQELARMHQLAEQLAREHARAEKVAHSLERTQNRIAVKVRVAARQLWIDRAMDAKRISELAGLLRKMRELEPESYRVQVQVQTSSQALERAQSRVQQLERALALAMAQARTAARASALARAPRLRAIATARFLWRLLHARRGLWHGFVRSLTLGMGVVTLLVWMLPRADRARWRQDSYSWLQAVKHEGSPLLGTAIRIALRIPWLALVLWTPPTGRWLARLKPLWIGLGASAATFLAGFAGLGQSPTDGQVRSLVAAALLAGAVAGSQAYKGRRSRRRRR